MFAYGLSGDDFDLKIISQVTYTDNYFDVVCEISVYVVNFNFTAYNLWASSEVTQTLEDYRHLREYRDYVRRCGANYRELRKLVAERLKIDISDNGRQAYYISHIHNGLFAVTYVNQKTD